jgi:hypothetical protein
VRAPVCLLYCPGLEATNWRAEQAIRPIVVARKVWGRNRTPCGAPRSDFEAAGKISDRTFRYDDAFRVSGRYLKGGVKTIFFGRS